MNGSARARTLSNRGGSITNLREHTLSQQILRVLARFGPMSRADVAAQCGLQVTALTNLITDLRNRDLVAELPKAIPASRGRPTYPVALPSRSLCVLAFDCSRTHIDAAIGSSSGEILHRRRHLVEAPRGGRTIARNSPPRPRPRPPSRPHMPSLAGRCPHSSACQVPSTIMRVE